MKSKINKLLSIFTLLLVLSINTGYAVPWCHGGTIVQIQNTSWTQAGILANYPGSIPSGLPDYGITGNAMNNYAMSFSGGGGSLGGFSVPGSGQVRADAYSPSSYLSGNNYSTSQGVYFKLNKCYTIPPMIAIKELASELSGINPDGPVIEVTYDALEEAEQICNYWTQAPITDPEIDGMIEGGNDVAIYLSQPVCR